MSFRNTVANIKDRIQYRIWRVSKRDEFKRISLTPVFHVERLYNDEYFNRLLEFTTEYKKYTGCRAVLTCMTPLSPILAKSLREENFPVESYWRRIGELHKHSIIGLHGHYVRTESDASFSPIHFAFNDIDAVERQLSVELEALVESGFVSEDLLIYSAGWWFTSERLRKVLSEYRFKWDYSISTSKFNISPGSFGLEIQSAGGSNFYNVDGTNINTALAVCSISRKDRSLISLPKIMSEYRHCLKEGKSVELSLYSHDYDLDLKSSLEMIQIYMSMGIRFIEPT